MIISLPEVKEYLEIDHDDDDTMLTRLINRSESKFQAYIGRNVDEPEVPYEEFFDGEVPFLRVRNWPIDKDSVVVHDMEKDEEIVTSRLIIYPESGKIVLTHNGRHKIDFYKGLRRWRVTYSGGLELDHNWERFMQDEIAGSLLDLVSSWYEDRNPSATSERSGSGMGTSFTPNTIPDRVRLVWDEYASVQF